MAAGKIEVIVTAKIDQLQASLDKVDQRIGQTQQTVGKIDSRMAAFGKTATRAAAALGTVGAVALIAQEGLKSVTRQVHLSKGAMALLSGDTDKAMEHLEKFGDSIRSFPILGGIIGGIADEIFNLTDVTLGLTEKTEALEEALRKSFVSLQITGLAKQYAKQNVELDKQIAILNTVDEAKKLSLQLDIDLTNLAEEQKKKANEIRRLKQDDAEAAKIALGILEQTGKKQEEILQAKHNEALFQMQAAKAAQDYADAEAERLATLAEAEKARRFDEEIQLRERTLTSMTLQVEMMSVEEGLIKNKLMHEKAFFDLVTKIEQKRQQIMADESLSLEQREKMLKLLEREEEISNKALEIERQLADEAHRRAEEERRISEQKEKQEALAKQLEAENAKGQDRLGDIKTRMGSAADKMKSGFTETGSTAMGSFTFAEDDAQNKIRDLNKEQADIQKQIEQRSERIEQLLEQLVGGFGVR